MRRKFQGGIRARRGVGFALVAAVGTSMSPQGAVVLLSEDTLGDTNQKQRKYSLSE